MGIAWLTPITVPSAPSGFTFIKIIWVEDLLEWWACATGPGVGTTTNLLVKSSDGLTWTIVDPGFQKGYVSIAYSPDLGQLCTLSNLSFTGGTSTHVITTSDDGGVTWVEHDIPDGAGATASNNSQFRDLCWAGGTVQKWVAVAQVVANAHLVMTSPDGAAWTNRVAAAARAWNSIVWIESVARLVATGQTNSQSNNVMTSDDGGTTWTSRNTPVNAKFLARTLAYGNSTLVGFADVNNGATSADRSHLFTSVDKGVTWVASTDTGLLANHGWENAAWAESLGLWLAVSQSAGPTPAFARSMTAADPTAAWTQLSDAAGTIAFAWNNVAWSPTLAQFAAVEQGGKRVAIAVDVEVVPDNGPPAGGTPVTITGLGFQVGVTTVEFDGVAATDVTYVSATTLTCVTPAHAVGTVDVLITNPDATTLTITDAFTYGGTIAPIIDIGPDQVALGPLPSVITTAAAATYGGAGVTYLWTRESGPATPTIASPTALNTDITFNTFAAGAYVFRLTVTPTDFPELAASATMTITIDADRLPVVTIDPDSGGQVTYPATATLVATVADAGWNGSVTQLWTQVAGPGVATIVSPTALTTDVSFPATQGAYVFRLTASNDVADGSGQIFVYLFAGTPAAPTYDSALSILIDDDERVGRASDGDAAFDGSLTITENPDETANTAQLTVMGPPPAEFQSIAVTLGARLMFAGVVLRSTHSFEGRIVNDRSVANCIDQTWHLTRYRVSQRWTNESASIIAAALVALVLAPGFTTDIEPGLPTIDTFEVINQTIAEALTALKGRVPHAAWKTRYTKVVYFGTVDATVTHPRPLTETDGVTLLDGFGVDSDGAPVVNRIKVTGSGSTITRDGAPAPSFLSNRWLFVADSAPFLTTGVGGDSRALIAGVRLVTCIAKGMFQGFPIAYQAATWFSWSVGPVGSTLPAGGYAIGVTLVTDVGESPILATSSVEVTANRALRLDRFSEQINQLNAIDPDLYAVVRARNIWLDGGSGWVKVATVAADASEVVITALPGSTGDAAAPPEWGTALWLKEPRPYLIVDPGTDLSPVKSGETIALYVEVNDTVAQAALALRFGGSDDGIIEDVITDGSIASDAEASQRGLDRIAERKDIALGVGYKTHDQDTHPAAVIVVALGPPFNVVDEFTIKLVTISNFETISLPWGGRGSWPMFTATAKPVAPTFEDLIRRSRL